MKWIAYVLGFGPGCACVCVCVCGICAVWFFMKRIPRWHFFEESAWKAAPSCAGRWTFMRRRVIWKVTVGWVCLLFSVHLQPIKRQDWQISPPTLLTYPSFLFLFVSPLYPLLLSSSFYHNRLGLTLVWKWPSSHVNFFNNSLVCHCNKVTKPKDIFSPLFLSQVKIYSVHTRFFFFPGQNAI